MPYKSEAQRKYFNANRDKLEAEGVDVDEWNESSKGKKLPEKKSATHSNESVSAALGALACQRDLEKQGFLEPVVGGAIGAYKSPRGSRLEGAGHGVVTGLGTGLGAGVLGGVGALGGSALGPAGSIAGLLAGLGAGGYGGFRASNAMQRSLRGGPLPYDADFEPKEKFEEKKEKTKDGDGDGKVNDGTPEEKEVSAAEHGRAAAIKQAGLLYKEADGIGDIIRGPAGKLDLTMLGSALGALGLGGYGTYRALTQDEDKKDQWDIPGLLASGASIPLAMYAGYRGLTNLDASRPTGPEMTRSFKVADPPKKPRLPDGVYDQVGHLLHNRNTGDYYREGDHSLVPRDRLRKQDRNGTFKRMYVKKSGVISDLFDTGREAQEEHEEEKEKLNKAVARNMRERLARQIAKEKVAMDKEATPGLIGGTLGTALGIRNARKNGRSPRHGAEEGFVRGALTGSGAGIGGSLGLLGSLSLMQGKPSTTKGVLAALLPLLGAGAGGYAGYTGGGSLVDKIRESREGLRDYTEEHQDNLDADAISDLAKAAVWQEKQAAKFGGKGVRAKGLRRLGTGLKTLGGSWWDWARKGRGGDSGPMFGSTSRALSRRAPEIAGFTAGSVGDVVGDPEQLGQVFQGQVPDKLWDPEKSNYKNTEGLWRRLALGGAAASVSSPTVWSKVKNKGRAAAAKHHAEMQETLGKSYKGDAVPSAGDYAGAVGRELLPKVGLTAAAYAPGMIRSVGETPDLIHETASDVRDLASTAKEQGEQSLKSVTESTEEATKGIHDLRKVVADVRQNVTGKDAGLPKVLSAIEGAADTAGGAAEQVGNVAQQVQSVVPGINQAAQGITNLNENIEGVTNNPETKKFFEEVREGARAAGEGTKALGEGTKDMSESFTSFAETAKKYLPAAAVGAIGIGGLYALYKVMQSRKQDEEDKERARRYPRTILLKAGSYASI